MDVSVRCSHAERYTDSAATLGFAASNEEQEEAAQYDDAVGAFVFETSGAHQRTGPSVGGC